MKWNARPELIAKIRASIVPVRYDGPGGAAYAGPGGPAYAGPGGPCYNGPGGPAYSGPGGGPGPFVCTCNKTSHNQ